MLQDFKIMMVIEKLMPNGTLLSYHKVYQVQITNAPNMYLVIINSYIDEAQEYQLFQQSYNIVTQEQIASFSDMERVLTETPDMPFYGAQLV